MAAPAAFMQVSAHTEFFHLQFLTVSRRVIMCVAAVNIVTTIVKYLLHSVNMSGKKNINYESIGQKIAHIRDILGLSQEAFAAKMDVSRQSIYRYESGSGFPDSKFLELMCSLFNVSPQWLISGDGDPIKNTNVVSESCPIRRVSWPGMPPPIIPETGKLDPDAFDLVPLAEPQLSAGAGAFVESEGFSAYYAFRKEWLRRISGSPDSLILVKVCGDSMQPTISDSDIVLVDTARSRIRSGAIYAIGIDDTISIKRLDLLPPDKVNVLSDNSRYQPYTAALDQVRILGQVIWFARELI